jgi:predicted nuclease of predicted toxin-antitoxin system
MRLLLDVHVAPAVARALRGDGIDALAMREWQNGSHLDASDEVILVLARADERTLVSYDCRTIPTLLKEFAETGQQHSGVILVDERTIRQADVGGLVRALRSLVRVHGHEPWLDRVVYLQAASSA